MSHRDRILRVLADGPSTSSEIACELHLSTSLAADTLARLVSAGRLVRSRQVRLRDDDNPTYIYALPEHGSALVH